MSDTTVPAAPPSNTTSPGSAAVTTLPPPASVPQAPAEPATTTSRRPRPSPAYQALRALASLRLTVVLFTISLLLVFFGTLAQIEAGIWTVVKDYFRSFVVWVPLQLLVRFGQVFFYVPRELQVGGSFPFPAGWTVGGLLLINLLAAHAVRLKVSWNRSGILILHAGLIVLLLGELITGLTQVEASMSIGAGETVNFTDVRQKLELAVTTTDPDDPKQDKVVTVPQHLIAAEGSRISDDQLPFDIEVKEYWKNSNLIDGRGGRDVPNPRKAADGRVWGLSRDRESSGVDTEAREDMPAARVAILRKGTDQVLAESLMSLWYYPNNVRRVVQFAPETVKLDGKTYTVELRPKREYKPFAIKLLEFRHDVYPGTTKPRNFSSLVELQTESGEKREAKIYMNNPLWHGQETYYQQSWLGETGSGEGTILQVVRNPGWFMPYLSCVLVTLGMCMHFGITLVNFLQRRAAP